MPVLVILFFSLVLIGCSTAPDCTIQGMSFYIETRPVDCAKVERNVDLAQSIIIAHGLATAKELKIAAIGTSVRIRAEETWDTGAETWGEYIPGTQEIVVNRHMQAFLHELLHRLDDSRGVFVNGAHPTWDENGYRLAAIEYNARLERL